jgi:ribose 1,5-bisphosphokinase PhnN
MIVAVVLIGSPGAGKSSVLEELATLHEIERVEHGTLEGEKLSLGWPLLPASAWVGQVESLLSFQRDAGRRLFLVSATVESAAELDKLRTAVAADQLLVVCLSASPETVAARIDAREPDRWPGKQPLIERARRLALSTPQLPAVDLVIETEGRVAQDVAGEIFRAMRERGMLDARG